MTDVVAVLIGASLVALACVFALLPLVRGAPPLAVEPKSPVKRFQLYQQVLEAEFDYQLGKLSAEDFERQKAELLGRASSLLREERAAPTLADIEAEIEREISIARSHRPAIEAAS
jgi:hypothetical protein